MEVIAREGAATPREIRRQHVFREIGAIIQVYQSVLNALDKRGSIHCGQIISQIPHFRGTQWHTNGTSSLAITLRFRYKQYYS